MPDHPQPLVIITAASGSGKTSITRYLLGHFPRLEFSISAATRQPRGEEKDGRDYYFISVPEFQARIAAGAFVEWEMVYEGKYYGTLRSELDRIWAAGRVPVLDIDVQGALKVQQQFAASLSLFIQPPSVEELRRRLVSRGTETPESLQARIDKAAYEISFRDRFNHVIINDQLDRACLDAERQVRVFLGLPA